MSLTLWLFATFYWPSWSSCLCCFICRNSLSVFDADLSVCCKRTWCSLFFWCPLWWVIFQTLLGFQSLVFWSCSCLLGLSFFPKVPSFPLPAILLLLPSLSFGLSSSDPHSPDASQTEFSSLNPRTFSLILASICPSQIPSRPVSIQDPFGDELNGL